MILTFLLNANIINNTNRHVNNQMLLSSQFEHDFVRNLNKFTQLQHNQNGFKYIW
jgi:hypothetical protein